MTVFAIEMARKPKVQTDSDKPRGDLAVKRTGVDMWTGPPLLALEDSNALQCADGRLLPWSGDVPVGSLEQARQAELAF